MAQISRFAALSLACLLALNAAPAPPKKSSDWASYDGALTGNRHSTLAIVNTANVAGLALKWSFPIPNPYESETTPLVVNGVMYLTTVNTVWAVNATTGSQIWKYSRPRSSSLVGDAAAGINRGVAFSGDRLFFGTDNAHLLALAISDGHVIWETSLGADVERFGSTGAPLVVGNLVYTGISGGDDSVRGFIAAFNITTGQQVWRTYTIPAPGDPLAATWGNADLAHGCGGTWMTGTYDNLTNLLYWTVGNPCSDYDGVPRPGDNLNTSSVLALNPATGAITWSYQFTPHDVFDFDGQQPPMIVDAPYHGTSRKLLLQASRNGFFYALDRSTGQFLSATPFVNNLTWATGVSPAGRPIPAAGMQPGDPGYVTICPASEGATNWMSTAMNPATGLFYVMALEKCGQYSRSGYTEVPGQPGQKVLRAIDFNTGNIAWQYPQSGSARTLGGVLSTAGGLVFFGNDNGDFSAVNAQTGAMLWSYPAGQPWHASPMTYSVDGLQYIAISGQQSMLVFRLP